MTDDFLAFLPDPRAIFRELRSHGMDRREAAELCFYAAVVQAGGVDALRSVFDLPDATAYRYQRRVRIALGGPQDGRSVRHQTGA
jgi:hypothetical protein